MEHGSLIISLDFELFWGVRDNSTLESYGANISGAKKVIPEMIRLFQKYRVHATFATVGLLFCKSKKEIEKYSPVLKPTYVHEKLSPYENDYLDTLDEEADLYHSAYPTIEELKKSNCIEIASHTFSHYYCWEAGQSIDQFEADIRAAVRIAADNGIQLHSIVFPRNQVPVDYLEICAKYNIDTYRGNPALYFNQHGGMKNKIMRFVDSYIYTGNRTTYDYGDIKEGKLFNVKASRLLRPYLSKFALFEGLKLKRIKNEMTDAAKHNRVYHLWWHPHNFGINQMQNLRMLEVILKHYQYLSKNYKFQSYTMRELSELLTNKKY